MQGLGPILETSHKYSRETVSETREGNKEWVISKAGGGKLVTTVPR